MTVMSAEQDKALFKSIEDRQRELQIERSPHEAEWTQVAEYMDPSSHFTLTPLQGAIPRSRRLVDTTAMTSANRLSAMLHGFMLNPAVPYIKPVATRPVKDRRGKLFMEAVQQDMHRYMSSGNTMFHTATWESVVSDVKFGNSGIWAGQSQVAAPLSYRSFPLRECFVAENDDGVIDTFHRRYHLTLRQAVARFDTPGLREKAEKKGADLSQKLTFIMAIWPRRDFRHAPLPLNKEYPVIWVCEETQEICEIKGFLNFPMSFTRFDRRSGSAYGRGVGWEALPLAQLLNRLYEAVIDAAELQTRPPLYDISGKLEELDLRAGAVNSVDASDALLMDARQIVGKLYEGGDPRLATDIIRDVRNQIEKTFYIDWMSLRENVQMTATEINDRRDMRLRSLTPIVSRSEKEKMTALAERTYVLMQRAGEISEAVPASLDGAMLDFEYNSPLAQAMRMSEVERFHKIMDVIERAAGIDPDVIVTADMPQVVRDTLEAAGAPVRQVRDEAEVASILEARRAKEAQAEQIDDAAAMAGAMRDGSQGLANLRTAQEAA